MTSKVKTHAMANSQLKLEQAIALHQAGQLAQAKAMYEDILLREPKHVDALHLLGVISISEQDYQRAVKLIDKAIKINPHQAPFYSNRGLALHELKQFEKAVTSYDRAITLNPSYFTAYSNRGLALHELKQYEKAVASYDRAIAIKPDYVTAYSNRGNSLQELNQFEKAIASFDRSIAINPGYMQAHYNRGNTLKALGQLEESIASFDRAIALAPDFADAYLNRGLALTELKQWEAAVASYDCAIAINQHYADAHHNKALALLAMGNFQQGWDCYEWRSALTKTIFHPFKIAHAWDGKKVAGSMLVLSEQGLGDDIFYSSMLTDLKGAADNITVYIDPRLITLYQRSFENISFISRKSSINVQDYDAQIYMASLGRYFRASEQALIDNVKISFLKACPEKSSLLRARLDGDKKLICGLSWISKNADFGAEKTLHLHDLKSILTLTDINFVNLQYGDTDEEQTAFHAETGINLTNVSDVDNFNDIDGLAALINACDIVLTISNTTAHLAAALGKPVIVMLPYARGLLWYWHDGHNPNPWYPTTTLVKQQKTGDWGSVVDTAKQALIAKVNEH
jgi:tetratricopeptide (TPR) repeat protein